MADVLLNYNKRNFEDIRTEVYGYIKQYYPEVLQDFTDSSVGGMMVDLVSAVGNILSYQTDRAFQETQIDNAQERKSILEIARTLGCNIPGKRASVTIVEFSITVPVLGDSFDINYCPILRAGAQATGGGKIFEALEDIDFTSPFSALGTPNRTIIPIINANDTIVSYQLVKQEVVYNGATKIFSRTINAQDTVPFFQIVLSDIDVVSVDQIVLLPGTNFTIPPSLDTFISSANRYYQVDNLAEDKVFVESPAVMDISGLKTGRYIDVTKKFIREFTPNGYCQITFGGGNGDLLAFKKLVTANEALPANAFIDDFSLGETLVANSTLFIKYRVGGGASSNIGSNILNIVGNVQVDGIDLSDPVARKVQTSIKVNNPVPALGGGDQPSVNQIRAFIKYNQSSQNRCVTLNDYQNQVFKMPGKFGAPFRSSMSKENNKVIVSILGLNADGTLNNSSNNLLKQNIAEYLSEFRMMNDYVEIRDGQIVNLAFDFELYVDETYNKNLIANAGINAIKDYFDINNEQMNTDFYLGGLIEKLNNIPGVLNVMDNYKVYNPVGTVGPRTYSLNATPMSYVAGTENTTRQISLVNNTIFSGPAIMMEIKYPRQDIRITIRTKTNL